MLITQPHPLCANSVYSFKTNTFNICFGKAATRGGSPFLAFSSDMFSEATEVEAAVEDADEDIPIGLMVMGIVVIMSSASVILVDCNES